MGMNSELSTYTISIYELIENKFDFGLDKYPIFDEAYRPILNDAILQSYLTKEIGWVNPMIFKQKLQNRMSIIMRNKYNALYKAKLMEFNPLYTMELYETYSHTIKNKGEMSNNSKAVADGKSEDNSNGTSTNNSTATNDSLSLSSQYPSDELTENDLTNNIYIDNGQKQTSNENTTNTDKNNSNSIASTKQNSTALQNALNKNNMDESYSKKTIGSASDLTFAHAMTQFKEYVDQFNLDQLVINELKDLFMTCW